MPVEYRLLKDADVPLQSCPVCQYRPFEPFLRGQVGRSERALFSWPPFKLRPHMALICWACKEIVGYESPWLDFIELVRP